MDLRRCKKCGASFPPTHEHFNRAANNGLARTCKGCDTRGGRGRGTQITPVPAGTEGAHRCYRCENWYPRDAHHFCRNRAAKGGLDQACKQCRREIRNDHYARNKKTQYEKNLQPKWKYRGYRNGARQRQIEWGLSMDDFMGFWTKPCGYCGSEIETIGLDRMDNSKGYTADNVIPCCTVCNRMKGPFSYKAWIEHIAKVLHNHGQ